MNLSELEKIVNDGKAKFKAYEQADVALSQLKALDQYEKETRAKLDASLAEIEKLKKSIEAFKAQEAKNKAQAEEVLLEAENVKKQRITEGDREARQLLAKAVLDADKMAQKRHADEKAAKEAEAKCAEWLAKAAAAKAEYDEIIAKFEKLKG